MKYLVVGSGIVGWFIARVLQLSGKRVILVEAQKDVGGLLGKSYEYMGLSFDYGTHLIPSTGNNEVDEVLLGKKLEYTRDWVALPIVKSGNYIYNQLNDYSPYIDIHCLKNKDYGQACIEILNPNIALPQKNRRNLLKYQLETRFGKTVTKKLYAPALKKLFGVGIKYLTKDAYHLVLPPRIILGSTEVNREMKRSPYFDERLAFSSFEEVLPSSKMHYYPLRNGVYEWISKLLSDFVKAGGSVERLTMVESLKKKKDGFSCRLSNGKIITVKEVWWTASPLQLFTLLGKQLRIESPITYRKTFIIHFVFNEMFLTNLYFLTCYDPKFNTFRVTLYPSINKVSNELFHCSVEVLTGKESIDKKKMAARVHSELVSMGVVDRKAVCLHSKVQSLGNTFPVKDKSFELLANEISKLESTLPTGIYLEGVAKGCHFFMRDVLLDAHNTLKNLRDKN